MNGYERNNRLEYVLGSIVEELDWAVDFLLYDLEKLNTSIGVGQLRTM